MKNQVLFSSKDKSKKLKCLQQTTFINTFSLFFKKIKFDVSSESFAGQRIHMKNQVLLSSKDKSKKLKCRLLQFLFGALGVNASSWSVVVQVTSGYDRRFFIIFVNLSFFSIRTAIEYVSCVCSVCSSFYSFSLTILNLCRLLFLDCRYTCDRCNAGMIFITFFFLFAWRTLSFFRFRRTFIVYTLDVQFLLQFFIGNIYVGIFQMLSECAYDLGISV